MAKNLITPKAWSAIMLEHDAYWDEQLPTLRKYKLLYEGRFWDRTKLADHALVIESSRGYEFIEGYIASLFSKNPAVVTKGDVRGRGNPQVAEGLSNSFLDRARPIVEDASRTSLIYPFSAIKMGITEHPDIYQRVAASAIPCWDVVVDTAAESWAGQRFVGHRYWVSVHQAKERWGSKDFSVTTRQDYIERNTSAKRKATVTIPQDALHEFIQVTEIYDLLNDRLLLWSPHYKAGKEWLYSGVEIEISEGETKSFDKIPFRDVDGHPVVPIIPLFYSRLPDQPLRGYSAMSRIYDQAAEFTIARTYQANAVRKCARQWLAKKGRFVADDLAKMVQGVDGEIIEIELNAGETLQDVIVPVPMTPTPPEVERYIQQVNEDFSRGSVLAPFSRGQATKASATEVTALAAYSSSEIGRLARERDAAIEQMARVYVSMLALYLEDGDNDLVVINGKATVVKSKDLQGNFQFFAQDGGSTPVSEAQRKSELLGAIPTLISLGVPPQMILKEFVRSFNLPESFLPDENPTPAPGPAGQAPSQPGRVPAPDIPMDTQLGLGPGQLPSPGQISKVLP